MGKWENDPLFSAKSFTTSGFKAGVEDCEQKGLGLAVFCRFERYFFFIIFVVVVFLQLVLWSANSEIK